LRNGLRLIERQTGGANTLAVTQEGGAKQGARECCLKIRNKYRQSAKSDRQLRGRKSEIRYATNKLRKSKKQCIVVALK
jgi:hypothetical protein